MIDDRACRQVHVFPTLNVLGLLAILTNDFGVLRLWFNSSRFFIAVVMFAAFIAFMAFIAFTAFTGLVAFMAFTAFIAFEAGMACTFKGRQHNL